MESILAIDALPPTLLSRLQELFPQEPQGRDGSFSMYVERLLLSLPAVTEEMNRTHLNLVKGIRFRCDTLAGKVGADLQEAFDAADEEAMSGRAGNIRTELDNAIKVLQGELEMSTAAKGNRYGYLHKHSSRLLIGGLP